MRFVLFDLLDVLEAWEKVADSLCLPLYSVGILRCNRTSAARLRLLMKNWRAVLGQVRKHSLYFTGLCYGWQWGDVDLILRDWVNGPLESAPPHTHTHRHNMCTPHRHPQRYKPPPLSFPHTHAHTHYLCLYLCFSHCIKRRDRHCCNRYVLKLTTVWDCVDLFQPQFFSWIHLGLY